MVRTTLGGVKWGNICHLREVEKDISIWHKNVAYDWPDSFLNMASTFSWANSGLSVPFKSDVFKTFQVKQQTFYESLRGYLIS